MSELYKRYNVQAEEVERWAKEKYPKWAANKLLILALYLKDKGVEVDPADLFEAVPDKTIAELKPGDSGTIEALVIANMKGTAYAGCPECMKKVSQEGVCPKHGPVDPVQYEFRRVIIADATGNAMLTVPPKYKMNIETGDRLVVRGIMNDRMEFFAQHLRVQKMEAPTVIAEPPPEELEKFKTVMSIFRSIGRRELENWAKTNNIKTPLDVLIKAAGCVASGDLVTLE